MPANCRLCLNRLIPHWQSYWHQVRTVWHSTEFHTLQRTIPGKQGSPGEGGYCTLIPAWMSNYIHYNMWDEITYPFPNFNNATVEVWKWISNFTPHSLLGMWLFVHAGIKLIRVSKTGPWYSVKPLSSTFHINIIFKWNTHKVHSICNPHIDDLMQERHNSSVLAMELRPSCINASTC